MQKVRELATTEIYLDFIVNDSFNDDGNRKK